MPTELVQSLVKSKVKDPTAILLAEWFYRSKPGNICTKDLIALQIQKIKEEKGTAESELDELQYKEYAGLISKAREYLEEKFHVTLICVRIPGEQYGGYKIANDEEATYIGIRTGKEVMMATARFRRRLPLIKKKYVWPSMKKVFGEAQEEIVRFRDLADRYIHGYIEGNEELQKEKKELEHKSNGK